MPTFLAALESQARIFNVKNYGATGNGSTDDTAAIQACIDAAFAASVKAVYVPAGTYKITSPIWLDPPDNLRAIYATYGTIAEKVPNRFNFTMTLIGDEGQAKSEGDGTYIRPADNSFSAIWVGPGQGMTVKHIFVWPASFGGPRKAYPQANLCAGFSVAGGPGGASSTFFECCTVMGYYYGFAVGLNSDGLGDSNTFFKCHADNCYVGYAFQRTQNYIHELISCLSSSCTISVQSPTGKKVDIIGGNYSTSSGGRAIFTISSVGNWSRAARTSNPQVFNYTFTAVVGSPDAMMNAGAYEACCVKTVHFGLVPLVLTSFNTGTNTATFEILPVWTATHFGPTSDWDTYNDVKAEVAACTTLYATEWIKTFSGTSFSIYGPHVENLAMTTLLWAEGSWTGDSVVKLEHPIINFDPAENYLKDAAGADLAVWYVQQCFPFIHHNARLLHVSNMEFGAQFSEPVNIDLANPNTAVARFDHCGVFSPVVRAASGANNPLFGQEATGGSIADSTCTAGWGGGTWDTSPFLPHTNTSGTNVQYLAASGGGHSPMVGYKPAPWATPTIEVGFIALLTANSGAPTNIAAVPPLCSATLYRVFDKTGAALTYTHVQRVGTPGYSFGKDLTGVTWSYKGASHVVNMDATSLGYMFPGLLIVLNDGAVDRKLLVTGVYPSLGYVTVINAASGGSWGTPGTKTTVYSGTTVKQERIALAYYGATPGSVNAQTGTTYTLALADDGKTITLNNASAITLTVPTGLGATFSCSIVQLGVGQVTVAASGTTINSYGGGLKIAGQHGAASLIATAANVFNLAGNITT